MTCDRRITALKPWVAFAALLALALISAAPAQAAPLDGTKYAEIAPTFYSASGAGTQSYIRLFSAAGTAGVTSSFTVTLVGNNSGAVYGSPFTIQIPYMASVQFSMGQLITLAGSGAALGGSDTGYAVWVQNSDPESGYEHVTYNATSGLFENMTNCTPGSLLNESLLQLHNELVITNLHSSLLAGGKYPATAYVYNPTQSAITYTISAFNGGNPGTTTPTPVATNSGKRTCQYNGNTTAQANAGLTIPELSIESSCTLDSDEYYVNLLVQNAASAGTTAGEVSNLVTDTAFGGVSNLTDVCAVNPATLVNPFPFVVNDFGGGKYADAPDVGIVTNVAPATNGGTPILTTQGEQLVNTTMTTSSTGFTWTLPAQLPTVGEAFNFSYGPGGHVYYTFEAADTHGDHNVAITLFNNRTPTLTYSTYGTWIEYDSTGKIPQALGTLETGNTATTLAELPTSGTVTYTGSITGFITMSSFTGTITGGTVSLTVNFATNAVTGTVTGMTTTGFQSTATGTVSNLTFNGTLSTTPPSPNIFIPNVTPSAGGTADLTTLSQYEIGGLLGVFYGPTANEIVGTIGFTTSQVGIFLP